MLHCNVSAGERWDVALTTDQPPDRYWLTVLGELECQDISQSLVVSYMDHVPDPLHEAYNKSIEGALLLAFILLSVIKKLHYKVVILAS